MSEKKFLHKKIEVTRFELARKTLQSGLKSIYF